MTLQSKENTPSNNEAVEARVQTMKEKRAQVIDAINQMAQSGQTMMLQYKQGGQVWLEAIHLKIRHQKTKLKPKQYGPFNQLRLPVAWGIYNVFHASLLSPYHETTAHGPNFSRPPPELIDGEEEYQVEHIIGH
jgi:hypothetical protein